MPAITDPNLLDQLNGVDPSSGAPPLTVTPGQQAPTGPITDPNLLKALNDAPDDPTPAQKQAAQAPSTLTDVAKGIGSGLVRGTMAIPGILGDVSNLAESLPSRAALHIADWTGNLPPGETYDSALAFANSPAMQAPPQQGTLGRAAYNLTPPTSDQLAQGLQDHVTGPLYQPQTPAGKVASNIAAFVPQAMAAPEALANPLTTLATRALAPGVASEAAGQAATSMLGDYADPYARAAGAIVGGGIGHYATAPTPAAALISGATRGVSDADLDAARGVMARAQAQGISLTPAEAIQQATGGASALGNLQRNIEGMSETAPTMSQFMAQRPGQVDQAARSYFDQVAPQPTNSFATGIQAQREAEGGMSDVRQDRSNLTGRYYQAAAGDEVPQDRMAAVAQQLDQLAAQNPNNPALTAPLADLRRQIVASPATPAQPAVPGQRIPVTDPSTGAVIRYNTSPGTPAVPAQPEQYITNVGQLDKIYGGLRDQYTGPAPLGQSGTDARAGRIAAQGLGYLNDELTAASPMLAAGRQAHGIVSDQYVAPREAGPLGQITQTNDLAAQGQALYPSNPNPGSEGMTAETVARMPQTAGAVTRNHLESAFNEATQNNQSGPNQWGGAKFAAQTMGNSQQAQNLAAGLQALPNGADVTPRGQALAEALNATGWRQPPGSTTAFNTQFREHMETGSPLGTAASLAASPIKLGEYAREWYEHRRIGSNAEMLAQMLTDPNGVDQIAQARNALPPDQYRSLLIQGLANRAGMAVPAAVQNRSDSQGP